MRLVDFQNQMQIPPGERIDNDLLQVAAMLSELKVTDAQVEKVIILLKRSTDTAETTKPRPIKIVFNSEDSKLQVLRNAKKPEKREGGRLGEIICTSRFYAETKRSKKQIGTGTEESYSPG